MFAHFRAKGDQGQGVVGTDLYLVVNFGTERGDKVGGCVVKGGGSGDVSEEVLFYKFFLRAPNLPSFFVKDGVLVRVNLNLVSTRRRSEEVRKKGDVDIVGFVEGGRRLYGGGSDWGWVTERWGWAPNDVFGRWGASWKDGGDGRWDVLSFFDEREFLDELVENSSVGGDVGEEVQRLVLNFVELITSDSEEGFEEEAGRWGGDVMVEER